VDIALVVALEHALADGAAVELHRLGVEVLPDDALELRPSSSSLRYAPCAQQPMTG
jgi:hypothetical protein